MKSPRPRSRIANYTRKDAPRRLGLGAMWHRDLYHGALTVPWLGFLGVAVAVFVSVNTVFALLYLARPGDVTNARPGSFWDMFFFSVETFATIGYGVLSPATPYANTVMSVESLTGIMLVALTTGIMFSRVSRPTSRVRFSTVAVVTTYKDTPTLMVRMANQRFSQILQAEVTMTLVRQDRSPEGLEFRRFYSLKLDRDRTPLFAFSFTVMHPIDEASPLQGCTQQSLERGDAEILVTVTGLDELMSQTVHARASYLPHEIRFGHRYADIFGVAADGHRTIDYRRFDATVPEGKT